MIAKRIGPMLWSVVGLALLAGCEQRPAASFTLRLDQEPESAEQVADKHRAQIVEYLEYFYGTPGNPQFAVPAPEEETAEEEATTDESTAAAEPPPGPKAITKVDFVDRETLRLGEAVYRQQCLNCHGVTGDGAGIAASYLNPVPRDYRKGTFKFISTPRGSRPRRSDLRRTILYGAKGTSMPSFRWMPKHELEAVIDYIMSLSARGELELQLIQEAVYELTEEDDFNPQTVAYYVRENMGKWESANSEVVLPLTVEPPKTPETVADGALAFAEFNCVKCHNRDGRGSKTADVGEDDWGRIAYPADLTMGTLHGGRRPIDIYRRIFAGINGTPMPAFGEPDSSKNETAEERSERIWHLVHFVTTVIEQNEIPPAEQKIIDEAIQRIKTTAGSESAAGGE